MNTDTNTSLNLKFNSDSLDEIQTEIYKFGCSLNIVRIHYSLDLGSRSVAVFTIVAESTYHSLSLQI